MRIAEWARSLSLRNGLDSFLALGDGIVHWHGVVPEARAVLLASAYVAAPRKLLIVTTTYEKALQWQARLAVCGVPESQMRQLPSGISALFEDASPETMALSERIGSMRFLVEDQPGIVIATAASALERTLPRDSIESMFFELRRGGEIDPDELARKLAMLGYENAEPVRIPGQYSRRGGIVDIFPMGRQYPMRIELFGEEIESMREFDPSTQRSTGPIEVANLSPSRETLYPSQAADNAYDFRELLEHSLEQESAALSVEAAARLMELIRSDAEALAAGVYFDRLDLYRPLLHPDSGCAIDLLGEDALLVIDEPAEVEAYAARSESELGQALQARTERGEILHSTAHDFVQSPEHIGSCETVLVLSREEHLPSWLKADVSVEIGGESLGASQAQPAQLALQIDKWLKDRFTIVLGTDQPTRATAVLNQVEVFPHALSEEAIKSESPGAFIVSGNLAGGFVLKQHKLALLTDQELFGVGRLRLPQKRFSEGTPVATLLDLKPGDYVVHINYGIGVFQGITKRIVDGVEKDYLFIQYQPPDKLFVPADQLDRIQKYLNPGDAEPKVNRVTGNEWQRTVGKAREEAREFARDLIQLYAKRKSVQRKSFGPDSPWQGEMEATFPWVETPSQSRAIKEAKRDLTLDYPMDRLICGDVGFGKTEVAIRSAFKVAQAGRQVAVLCPTTILSEQHYRNFAERLAPFPVRLELLNRFTSSAERKSILKRIESGEVDIVIGTHALLSKELRFKELGLVVIDEEQKFGVRHKEALKALRVSVDILTLSATPIPRTLSMSLMDIRQMSLINDPPPGRLPIRTYIRPYSKEVILEAILRETARGGQVYYVYNRVQGIQHIAERLRKLVPNARIGVGHGQMHEAELEPVMIGFIKGEIDILLSTTIIENGLDIPNANTLIVEDADRLGLAQLYQLRGRVGRSDRQAYAYFLHGSPASLTEGAMARLASLQEFSSLGSGYSLAFRDLQIRGAGELLGSKQSGAMASVGFELFSQIIHEEVQFLKRHAEGDEAVEYRDPLEGLTPLPMVDLPVSAMIPEEYIADQSQRLYYYKQMMSARSPADLADVEKEIEDRYGRFPQRVGNALSVMRLRIEAANLDIEKVDGAGGRLAVTPRQASDMSPRIWSIIGKNRREAYFTKGQLIWPFTGDAIDACERMLATYKEAVEEVEQQRAALSALH